jgi:TonB-linked SusC/RagA family outer membrane protein
MTIKKLIYALVLPLLLLAGNVSAQERTVTGRVTDSAGAGVSNASVVVRGGKSGTQTAADGTFSLKVPSNATGLTISSVGYGLQTVDIGNGPVNVTLRASNAALSEVVVIAYGTRRRGDLTGSVTAVSAKDFQKGNIASPEQLLVGKVPGMQITSGGGAAGGGSMIRIRGTASLNASNDPLVVIDGIPVEGNGINGADNLLATINPNDIESISVLKDASASALYGSRASNGVIIVTTKKGTQGGVKYNFSTQLSAGVVAKTIPVLTGDQIRSIITEQATISGNNTYKNMLGTANTDWQREIYRTAIGTDNTISASGTVNKVLPFRASLGYYDQNGILKTDNFKRISGSLNLSPKFFDNHLSVNLSFKASHVINRKAEGGAIGSAAGFDPTKPVRDTSGKDYGGYYEWLTSGGVPLALATRNPLAQLELTNNKVKVGRQIGNVQFDYKLHFLPDLHVLANVGLDHTKSAGNYINDSTSAQNYLTRGYVIQSEQEKMNTLAEVSLFYSKELRSINSRFDVLVGHTYQDFLTKVTNFPAFSQRGRGRLDTIAGSVPVFATDRPRYRLEGYIGRINYTLADKYLLTASIRRDASSKFASDNRVGYFPAAAFAWKIKQDLFKNSNVLTDLKLRVGYGLTGQQDGIDYYGYIPKYGYSSSTAAQYQLGTSYQPFLGPLAYNPNLKWETTATTNVGLDFSFLRNRISGSIDYYIKKTKDLLSVVNIAPGENFDITQLQNVGNMENKGVEFALNTTPVRNQDFTWDFGFNVTWQQTKITNLLRFQDPNFKGLTTSGISGGTGNNIGKLTVGYAPYAFFMYQQVYGVDGKPIEGLYEDIDRDGATAGDDGDRYYYKKPAPDVLAGINTQVAYRKWSLGLAGHASFGNYLYNNYASNTGVLNGIQNGIGIISNASTNYLSSRFVTNQYLSDYYIENASFFRLDNINIGYNAGRVFKDKARLRVSASIQNVFVITKYTGLDPEVSGNNGVDNNIYPRPRVFSLGANLEF